jgi:diguanylate cyclase (GGDEF)-like protein
VCSSDLEEFGVLLPDTSLEAALVVAERARASIEAEIVPVVDTGKRSSVTASIGVSSVLPTKENTSNQLIGLADKCLYEAKNSGRNRIKSACVN